MKKIEKLELPYDDGKGNFSSGSGEIHILRKVNEIIDVLNSWVFEPTLTIPSQSQEQPEGKCIHYFPLSSEGVCQKCGIKFEDIKSEKQEEGTFNKEELETLKLWGESLKFWELFVSDSDNALREKISKLLKEEE
jgi:hypothetical protein